jgi:hypothetical protein
MPFVAYHNVVAETHCRPVPQVRTGDGRLQPSATFESIPDDIIRRILDFLLSTSEVRVARPPPMQGLMKYDIHTSIMRVSKHLYGLAKPIMQSNSFVLVSTTNPSLLQHLTCHDISLWTRNISHYQGYRLRLHITFLPSSEKVTHFFLICSREVERFVVVLRMMIIVSLPQFRSSSR